MLQQMDVAVQGGDQKALAVVRHRDAANRLLQLVRDQLTLTYIVTAQAAVYAPSDDLITMRHQTKHRVYCTSQDLDGSLATRAQVPNPHSLVMGSTQQYFFLGTKGQSIYFPLMAGELSNHLSRSHIPLEDELVGAT